MRQNHPPQITAASPSPSGVPCVWPCDKVCTESGPQSPLVWFAPVFPASCPAAARAPRPLSSGHHVLAVPRTVDGAGCRAGLVLCPLPGASSLPVGILPLFFVIRRAIACTNGSSACTVPVPAPVLLSLPRGRGGYGTVYPPLALFPLVSVSWRVFVSVPLELPRYIVVAVTWYSCA